MELISNLYFYGNDRDKYANVREYVEANLDKVEVAWQRQLAYHTRWLEHLEMVLEYQRELYEASGGVPFDQGKVVLEVGGAVASWHHVVPIIRINPKTVTVVDTYNWPMPGHDPIYAYTRTVKKADIGKALTRAQYETLGDTYEIGQKLIALLDERAKVPEGFEPVKGGAIKYRYNTWSAGRYEWAEVIRVNPKTVTVRTKHNYETKFEKSAIYGVMTPEEWRKHQDEVEDATKV